jgi:hypothetical protein
MIDGETTGNERLTAATGVLLLAPLAVIGLTLLHLRGLLSVHLFVGMLLIPPVLLKMASTGYRFVRYYIHDPSYRRKGPPAAIMRSIAPIVVISTVVVLASGVALLVIGPSSRHTLLPIHKVSFIVWVLFTALHVLGHLPDLPRALSSKREIETLHNGHANGAAEWRGSLADRSGWMIALSGALVGGVVLAIIFVPEFGPWLHDQHRLLTGGR